MNRRNRTDNNANVGQWEDAAGNGWWNAEGGEWNNAAGDQDGLRTSQPYIITVQNNNGFDLENIEIGGSYHNRTADNYGNPAGIVITYYIPGVNYVAWLAQTETQPFNIGRTMLVCPPNHTAAGRAETGNPERPYTIRHKDATGALTDHVIPPIVDPYQTQTDRVIDEYNYLFDGYTYLIINQMDAGSQIILYLFPTAKTSQLQAVAGRVAGESFNAPHLIKVAPVAIGSPRTLPG